MSSGISDEQRAEAVPATAPANVLADRLPYLLKHAWLRLGELTATALAPYGLSGRELAVLLVLQGSEPASQQEAAQRLGVDRTTMVALLDDLERKGFVARRPDPGDRRRNVVEVTAAGRTTLGAARRASEEAEQVFLAPLSERAARQLKDALRALASTSPPSGGGEARGAAEEQLGGEQ